MSTTSLSSSLASALSASSQLRTDQLRRSGSEKATGAPSATPRPTDSVELSSQAQQLSQESDAPIRLELVNRVRLQIAEGTYENPAKLEIASLKLRRELRSSGANVATA